MARSPDKLAGVAWRDRVEVVRGDLGDPDSLTAAFDGMDVVYYLVHSMGTSRISWPKRPARLATSSPRPAAPVCGGWCI